MSQPSNSPLNQKFSPLDRIIRFCLDNKLVVCLLLVMVVGWGVLVAPFDWELGQLPRDPVPVDAIPDIGENQQIVFTDWPGRSPEDVEDQISYPLTVSLMGIPGVKEIRSNSMFGFSTIFIVFDEGIEFYWSRSRILEKLASLPAGTLPEGVQPALGPDATALGQVFWYTLEGRDPDGNPIGGWDLHELRTTQDWHVRYGLLSAEGVSEVASIGGFVQEYQIDVDPDAMRAHRVMLEDVFQAVHKSNVDVGARTIEVSRAEYVIRGLGFFKNLDDIEHTVVATNDRVPIYVKDVANVSLGPALRRGALDKEGAEAVGGVVVVRFGFNPLEAIANVKAQIDEIAPGLPTKALVDYRKTTRREVEAFAAAQGFKAYASAELNEDDWLRWLRGTPRAQWPQWINTSQVTVVPFYDRTGLIYETLETLNTALSLQILVTIIVVIAMVLHLRASLLISIMLPLAVLMTFIAMKTFGVDANIVALSGIAIAIGTIADVGIILTENILKHLERADPQEDRREVVFRAAREVSSAVVTAVATTVVSFLPVFTMIGEEGRLFRPLAFTKTFVIIAAVIIALTLIPPAAHVLLGGRITGKWLKRALLVGLMLVGFGTGFWLAWWVGLIVVGLAAFHLVEELLPARLRRMGKLGPWVTSAAVILLVGILLTQQWLPLGPERGVARNFIFIAGLVGGLLLVIEIFQRFLYVPLLRWCLAHKAFFLSIPTMVVLLGLVIWLGFGRVFGVVPWTAEQIGVDPRAIEQASVWQVADETFPGLGREFMPALDEGSFLFMPVTLPHASIGEVMDVMRYQDQQIAAIPEVETVVGKLGRAETPLDPAPISMIETLIQYKSEYITDERGRRLRFRYDSEHQEFVRDEQGNLIADTGGRPYRQWRDHIRSADDIWDEIIQAAEIPGTTVPAKLQPIETRLMMLRTGLRAPMGVKVRGSDLETLERVLLDVERFLKEVPTVAPATVSADRIIGKPYLEIDIDRHAIARYGVNVRQVQNVIEVAIGGRRITTTVEGRERFPVRARYQRELRDEIETLGRILVPAADETQIPLEQLAEIRYVRGPQSIKSEDTFLVGYVIFDMQPGHALVNVVEESQRYLQEKIATGEFVLPEGVSYRFAGDFELQVRAQQTLSVILPLALLIIFLILYFQFRSVVTSSFIFTGIVVAWCGGFLMLWLYGQPWFLNFEVFGVNMADLFQVRPINLSVAVWVGFLALFGIATDNGVVITTYLDQNLTRMRIESKQDIREATVEAGRRRIRPMLMTTATTILALLPVLASTGRGADIMVPMAIPSFGGMTLAILTTLVVPVLYSSFHEWKLKLQVEDLRFAEHPQ